MTVSCCVFINQSIIGEVRRKVAPSSPGAVTPGPYLFMGPFAVAETKTARVSKRLGLHIDGVLYKKEKNYIYHATPLLPTTDDAKRHRQVRYQNLKGVSATPPFERETDWGLGTWTTVFF